MGHPDDFHGENSFAISGSVVRVRQELNIPELLIGRSSKSVTMNVTVNHNLGINIPTTHALHMSITSGFYACNTVPVPCDDFGLSNSSTCKQHGRWNSYMALLPRVDSDDGNLILHIPAIIFAGNHSHTYLASKVGSIRTLILDA